MLSREINETEMPGMQISHGRNERDMVTRYSPLSQMRTQILFITDCKQSGESFESGMN
jgi:hypothetical protein